MWRQRTNEIARALVGSVPDAVTEDVARAVEDTETDEDKKPFDVTLGPQLDLFGDVLHRVNAGRFHNRQ